MSNKTKQNLAHKKLKACILANSVLLIIIIIILSIFRSESADKYWNYGPNKDLILISIQIDTWKKYFILLVFIALIRITEVVVGEIANPILGFSIYNPDKKVITEFTKNELQIYGNTMFLIDAVRGVLMIMLIISQFDVAIFGVIISQITSIFTIRSLLNEKEFVKDENINKYEVEPIL